MLHFIWLTALTMSLALSVPYAVCQQRMTAVFLFGTMLTRKVKRNINSMSSVLKAYILLYEIEIIALAVKVAKRSPQTPISFL